MSLNIVFMGTPEFAVPTLDLLVKNKFNVVKVYTQPPRKSKRGQKINPSPIEKYCKENKISFRNPEILNTEEELKIFKELSANLIIVVAYGKIIPKNFLNIAKFGFINIHASLLPKWRGAAPIQRAIMNGDKKIGVSIMKIEEKLDSGPVSNVYKIKLHNNVNAQEVSEKLSNLAAEKILDNIDDILEDKAKFVNQDHTKASYAKKIDKNEGKINWNDEAKIIIGKINGLFPIPGAFFNFHGERYKILKAEIGNGIGQAGKVISDKLEVACNNNKSIKIIEIQRQGKKVQKTGEFLLGSQIKKGTNLN